MDILPADGSFEFFSFRTIAVRPTLLNAKSTLSCLHTPAGIAAAAYGPCRNPQVVQQFSASPAMSMRI